VRTRGHAPLPSCLPHVACEVEYGGEPQRLLAVQQLAIRLDRGAGPVAMAEPRCPDTGVQRSGYFHLLTGHPGVSVVTVQREGRDHCRGPNTQAGRVHQPVLVSIPPKSQLIATSSCLKAPRVPHRNELTMSGHLEPGRERQDTPP